MVQRSFLRIGYLLQNDLDLNRPSGPSIHVVHIIRGLQRRGHSVRTIQLAGRAIRWSDDLDTWQILAFPQAWRPMLRLVERPIRLAQTLLPSVVPYLNYFDSLRFADAARSVLGHVHLLYERFSFMSYGGLLLSHQLRVPFLLEVNGNPFDEVRHTGFARPLSRTQEPLSRWLMRQTLANADCVLASGYGWRKRLAETISLNSDRCEVVWPGTDYELFVRSRDLQVIRNRWGIGDGPVVVFVGGFLPWQGLEMLMCAFTSALRYVPAATLLLAGDGPLRPMVEALVRQLGCVDHVKFLGLLSQEGVAEALAVADIGVLLIERHAEYVGMKLFDYMASGLAIIVTAPARRHDLIVDGETGLVIEPGSQDDLSAALVRLMQDSDLRRSLGTKVQSLARSQHTWEHRVVQIEKLASELLARKPVVIRAAR